MRITTLFIVYEAGKIPINATIGLWTDFHKNFDFHYLLTNRLNQDCIENLFSIIRGKGENRDNPSPVESRASFRQVVFDQILEQSAGSNCKADLVQILLSLTNMTANTKIIDNSSGAADVGNNRGSENLPSFRFRISFFMKPPTELPEQNVEAYMAGYLLANSKIGTCNTCKKQCQYDKPPDTDQYIFLKKKAYQIQNTLVYPTEAFIEFAENLEILFLRVFDTVKFLDGILD